MDLTEKVQALLKNFTKEELVTMFKSCKNYENTYAKPEDLANNDTLLNTVVFALNHLGIHENDISWY